MKNNRYINWLMAATMMIAAFATAACEDEPDKYEVAADEIDHLIHFTIILGF